MKIFSIRLVAFVFVLGLGIVQPGFCLDSTGFNPATVSVQSVGSSIPVGTVITWPSSSWPPDADNWLECNGQAINSTVYPELIGVLGKTAVPDYRGRFLRGLQSGHSVGENVANSIKSHNHTQPTHTHTFSGQLVSTALSGTAGGQSFSSAASLGVSGWAAGQSITSGGAGGQSYQTQSGSSGGTWISIDQTGNDSGIAGGRVSIKRKTEEEIKGGGIFGGGNKLVAPGVYENSGNNVVGFTVGGSGATTTATTSGGSIWGSTGGGGISGTASGTVSGTTNASGVSGNLRNGSVTGTVAAGGGNPTDYTGEAETAPDHVYVRCLIRAKP